MKLNILNQLLSDKTGAIIISLLCISLLSCEDEEPVSYIGKWRTTVSQTIEGTPTELLEETIIRENAVESQFYVRFDDSQKWTSILHIFGHLKVTGSVMETEIIKIGLSTTNFAGNLTEDIHYLDQDDSGFEELLKTIGLPTVSSIEFSIQGKEMTQYSDNNQDGDYDDELESIVYTRISI